MSLRTSAQRINNAKQRLETDSDVWLATASPAGAPHLIPLSLGWDGHRLTLFTYTDSVTTRNVETTGLARASLTDTLDVVIIDGSAAAEPLAVVASELVSSFADRTGWDPRREGGDFSLISLTPVRVVAWNSVEELQGRTIMRDGRWVDGSN